MPEKIDIKKFKNLIYELYNNYPNYRLNDSIVKKVIITEEDRKILIKTGILFKESINNKKHFYGLAPNGLNLVSAWNTEFFTKIVLLLTLYTFILQILSYFSNKSLLLIFSLICLGIIIIILNIYPKNFFKSNKDYI